MHPGHRNSLPVHIHGEAQLRGALSKSHDGQVHGRSTHHYLPVHVATAIVHATGGRHRFRTAPGVVVHEFVEVHAGRHSHSNFPHVVAIGVDQGRGGGVPIGREAGRGLESTGHMHAVGWHRPGTHINPKRELGSVRPAQTD